MWKLLEPPFQVPGEGSPVTKTGLNGQQQVFRKTVASPELSVSSFLCFQLEVIVENKPVEIKYSGLTL